MSRYIFYAHPRGILRDKLYEFWSVSKQLCAQNNNRNDALVYPFHVTLTSFFTVKDVNNLQNLIDIAKSCFEKIDTKPVVSKWSQFFPNVIPESGPKSNLNSSFINLSMPSVYDALRELKNRAVEYDLRIKNNFHLTLYNNVSYDTMMSLETGSLPSTIRFIDWNEIDIVLWEVTDKNSWKMVHKF